MVSEDILQKVRVAMRGLKAPGFGDRVYKDECMFTFDTPESPGGLYINLHTFQVGWQAVWPLRWRLLHDKTFLHMLFI